MRLVLCACMLVGYEDARVYAHAGSPASDFSDWACIGFFAAASACHQMRYHLLYITNKGRHWFSTVDNILPSQSTDAHRCVFFLCAQSKITSYCHHVHMYDRWAGWPCHRLTTGSNWDAAVQLYKPMANRSHMVAITASPITTTNANTTTLTAIATQQWVIMMVMIAYTQPQ